jgi:hypothetical protein
MRCLYDVLFLSRLRSSWLGFVPLFPSPDPFFSRLAALCRSTAGAMEGDELWAAREERIGMQIHPGHTSIFILCSFLRCPPLLLFSSGSSFRMSTPLSAALAATRLYNTPSLTATRMASKDVMARVAAIMAKDKSRAAGQRGKGDNNAADVLF